MCSERAEDIMRDVFDIGQSMRRAIDAKSSESIGVNRQTQNTTILGMMGKNKQERVITFKDQAKKSLFSSFMGKEADKAADEE
jgi:CheY-specific phosphatase CheX